MRLRHCGCATQLLRNFVSLRWLWWVYGSGFTDHNGRRLHDIRSDWGGKTRERYGRFAYCNSAVFDGTVCLAAGFLWRRRQRSGRHCGSDGHRSPGVHSCQRLDRDCGGGRQGFLSVRDNRVFDLDRRKRYLRTSASCSGSCRRDFSGGLGGEEGVPSRKRSCIASFRQVPAIRSRCA